MAAVAPFVQVTGAELGPPGGDDPAILEHGHLAELDADVGEQQPVGGGAGTDGARAYGVDGQGFRL
jgi:hypothetical protein